MLSNFSCFEEVLTEIDSLDNLSDQLANPQVENENLIQINIFIDDFQLCNPLLSKKSQENSMTGIYYRIISPNKFKFSGHRFIYLLGLCYSSTFKQHSEVILQYISRKVNKFIDNLFPVSFGDLTRYCKVSIGYFSLDSKAASFLLGLKQSFNHRYCCRFCIESRESFNQSYYESQPLRDQNLYQHHLCEIPGLLDG